MKPLTLCLIFLILGSCTKESTHQKPKWQRINGREGAPIYRAKVPSSWQRKDPGKAVYDTTKPLVEFIIENDILITVHSFPGSRIPPGHQVMRWKRQAKDADPKAFRILPCSHGGFAGLEFEGQGCLAWAMQMDPDHYQKISGEMKADYTIKAVGPSDKLLLYRDEITLFARSFELIEEIPK